jgi:hypothetical protein
VFCSLRRQALVLLLGGLLFEVAAQFALQIVLELFASPPAHFQLAYVEDAAELGSRSYRYGSNRYSTWIRFQ